MLAIDPANLREEGSAAEQGEQLFQALPRHFPDTSETPPRHFLALPGEQLFLARALLPLSPLSLSPLSLSVALSRPPALMTHPTPRMPQALLGGAADARLPGDRRREHRSRVAAVSLERGRGQRGWSISPDAGRLVALL